MSNAKQIFIESLLKLPFSNRSELYTTLNISQKIDFMSTPIPNERSARIRWQRLHQRFKIVPYQSTRLLYLKMKGADCSQIKRVVAIEELYDIIKRIHIEHNHARREGLHKRLTKEFHGITEKACTLFLESCEECHLRKAKKSVKSVVVKPISSTQFLSRCQVDLIDFRDMSEQHNMSESGVPYKWLLVYQDHFTKYILLRPLKHKSAVEVADTLEDYFCELGPPHILQSDNGGEFCNSILFSLIDEKWPSTKIIHGKPRHPASQGSVERANREIKNALGSKMRENSNDLSWVKYLRRVQFEKNTTFHSTIGMTPYEALFHHKPSFGLSDLGIPEEFAPHIQNEEDLEAVIGEINASTEDAQMNNYLPSSLDIPPITGDVNDQQQSSDRDSESFVIPIPQLDSYLDEISQPIPDGTRVFGSDSSPKSLNCVVCSYETSGVHSCPGCSGSVHVHCGMTEGEEGYGSPVWCNKCYLSTQATKADGIRAGIKRNQEKLHDRMLVSSAKKFHPANIGDNVLVPIERPDKMNSLGPRNMLGVVTNISEGVYTIGTRDGTLNTAYTRNQFEVCSSNSFLQPTIVPPAIVSQTSAMRNAS